MNKKQKIILAIFVPVIIFFLALTIVHYTGIADEHYTGRPRKPGSYTTTYSPFNWGKTWYIWLFFIIFICVFEYKLFADKKIIINKKKKNNLI